MFLYRTLLPVWGLCALFTGINICAAESMISSDKLMLHYRFSTENINHQAVADLSGNAHHGKMLGDFQACADGTNQGVIFNGKNTAVIPGRAADLRLNGAFSVALQLRITPQQAEAMRNGSPLLFGTPDTRSILRNYTLFFDYGRRLELDVGNGIDNYNAFTTLDLADGKLHNIVYVVAPPMAWIYIDGKCVKQTAGASIQPTAAAGSADPIIGCWSPGNDHFQGELYELRLYNRALSFREVINFSGISQKIEPEADLNMQYSAVRNALDWDIYARNIEECDGTLTLEVQNNAVWQCSFRKSQFIGERLSLSGFSSLPELPVGKHEISFVFKNSDNRELFRYKSIFNVTALEEPERFHNTIGISNEVLPPWTPMYCQQNSDGSIRVEVWNRTYHFHREFMAFDFISGNESLMYAPGKLDIVLSGNKKENIRPGSLEVIKSEAHQTIIRQTALSESFRFEVIHCIDYDGFDRINLKIMPRRKVAVKQMFFQLPVTQRRAVHSVPGLLKHERISGVLNYPFTPVYYLGDEYKGLHFIADSDEHYYPYDHNRVMSIEPQDKQVLWKLRFIDADFEFDQPVKYEFALQAAPVRPVGLDAWERRVVVMAPYCGELELLSMRRNGVSAIEDYARLGARAFAVMRVEKPFAYPTIPDSDYAKQMRPITQRAHELGISMYPYTVSFVFSELAPEWNERELYLLYPRKSYTDCGDTLERECGVKQDAHHVCNNIYYQNLMLYRLQNAMLYEQTDGVYLDGTTSTRRCENSRHGCGYLRADGKYQGTYCGFATRDMLRRLYTLVWQMRGEKGGVDLHMSDAYHISAAAYATTRWMGEGLPKNELITQSLPLEDYRLLYTGRNIGSPADLLTYTMGQKFRTSLALSLLHNMPARPHGGMNDIDLIAPIWQIRDNFGCSRAEFTAYWEKHAPLKAAEKNVYVSIHRHPDGRALATVANLSADVKQVHLQYTPEAEPRWKLPEVLEIPAQDFRLVELTPAEKE
ncbi:MAG: LamG domain-containing protein [Lentisphaerae bacterium]|nr:LamG domain-containing protein [Lentisphaerota bacterium]